MKDKIDVDYSIRVKIQDNIAYSVVSTFIFIIIILLLNITTAFYMYKVMKNDLHEELLKDVRKGICDEKFIQLLNKVHSINQNASMKNDRAASSSPANPKRFRRGLGGISLNVPALFPVPQVNMPQPLFPKLNLPVPLLPPRVLGNHGKAPCICTPGPPGAPGSPGSPGSPGKPGPRGISGFRGSSGQTGPSGPQGPPGPSGPKGDQGFRGGDGYPGDRGEKGDSGTDGIPGERGYDGSPGLKGEKGERGFPGINGNDGPRGDKGECCAELCDSEKKYTSEEYPTLDIKDRSIVFVGTPEFFDVDQNAYGSWMMDSKPLNENDQEKVWVVGKDNITLIEFENVELWQSNKPSKVYDLDVGVDGNANVVYKGKFYYKTLYNVPKIIRYDLENGNFKSLTIVPLKSKEIEALYSSNNNHFDFSVDEHGLWVIYALPGTDNTGIAKINAENMTFQKITELSINSKSVIDMFVAYDSLYTLQSSETGETVIHKAINLFSNKVSIINVKGILPSKDITMVTYDMKRKRLMVIDKDKKISYPLIWNDDDELPTDVNPE